MQSLQNSTDMIAVRERIQRLAPTDAARWGVMNVVQMMCHLREAYKFGSGPEVAALLPSPLPRSLMKWMALRAPMKWPQGVPTVAELKVGMPLMAESPLGFEEDKRTLLESFDAFAGMRSQTKPHPIFGAMRHSDWMRWGYLHADHHLRQFGR